MSLITPQISKDRDKRLYNASRDGRVVEVIYLIQAGANVNNKEGLNGRSPLYGASVNGHVQIVQLLIDNGADINHLDNGGYSPLYVACWNGHVQIVQLLINSQANVNQLSNSGRSPLSYAVEYNMFEVIKLLIANGAENAPKIKTIIDNNEIVDEIIQSKTKQWGRAKWMIIGPGTAGKTAFARSIIGLEFKHTTSTVGLEKPGVFDDVLHSDNNNYKSCKLVEFSSMDSLLNGSVAELLNINKSINSNGPPSSSINLEEMFKKSNKQPPQKSFFKAAIDSFVNGGSKGLFLASTSRPNQLHTINNNNNSDVSSNKDSNAKVSLELDKIMKSLGTIKTDSNSHNKSSGVILTIYDFAGQSVFDVIHHMFLTSYGVYTLVFNMELLVDSESEASFKLRSSSDPKMKWCISYLKYWMNAIFGHCKLIKSNDSNVIERPPPVILIGTRKDKINNNDIHKQISELLYDQLHHTAIWNQSLQLNEDDDLNFFPVDNTMTINDDTVRKVVMTVNNIITNKPYVTKQIPLTWLQLVDHMNMLKDNNNKSFINLNELISISNNYGINEVVLYDILEFLNEMSENRTHHSELQKRASLIFPSNWNRFVSEGIASIDLITFLLSEYSDRLSVVMLLMVKFGLMVRLNPKYDVMNGVDSNNNNAKVDFNDNDCRLYLFPSIIPNASNENLMAITQRWSSVEQKHIVHFILTAREDVASVPIISLLSLAEIGFGPVVFFHRLVGKVLTWCLEIHHVSSLVTKRRDPNNQIIYGDMIELTFINQRFLIQLLPDHNCLEVMIEGENPLAIHRRLKNQINEVISECFPKLHVIDAVAYPYGSSILQNKNVLDFIPLSYLKSAIKNNDSLLIMPDLIRPDVLRQTYHSWIPPSIDTPFDVFISYRWNDYDSKLTKKMFDILSSFNQPNNNAVQALHVFRDVEILYEGANLKESFSSSLFKSKLFVPIISYNALQRLVNHDVN
eukprot:gene10357-13913_t